MSSTIPRCFGLIPAAGVGSRMQSTQPKQFLQVSGQTILQHSVNALSCNARVGHVLVVVSAQDDVSASHLKTAIDAPDSKLSLKFCGGTSRAESVLNGLLELVQSGARPTDWVLVHDAARPGLSQSALNRLIDRVLGEKCGGILALPVVDTIKKAKQGAGDWVEVEATLDRSVLWQAQTPQMFQVGHLKTALEHAAKSNFAGITDEASAIEQTGGPVLMVAGERCNLKVTVPEDLEVLAHYLNRIEESKDKPL